MELYQWTKISGTAAGTTVVSNRSGVLNNIVFPAAKTGTIALYDSATAAGTSLTNHIYTFDNNVNAGNVPASLEVKTRFKNGLVAIVSGTTDVVAMWGY